MKTQIINTENLSSKENSTTNRAQSKTTKNINMKKLIIITTAILLTASIFGFVEMKNPETPVSKDINVEVYKTASYISPAYENTTATLEVTVVRMKGNKIVDTAFQHTFQPKQLKDYPESTKPMIQKITIPNVNDKKERLEVFYKLKYDSKGSVLNFLNTTTIGAGQQSGKLDIQI